MSSQVKFHRAFCKDTSGCRFLKYVVLQMITFKGNKFLIVAAMRIIHYFWLAFFILYASALFAHETTGLNIETGFKNNYLFILQKTFNFVPVILVMLSYSGNALKRESGENPEQTRCCKLC